MICETWYKSVTSMEAEWKHASTLSARIPQGSGAHEWRVSIDTQCC
jgi:hypothetical protein